MITKAKSPILVSVLLATGVGALISVWANPGIYEPYVEGQDYFRLAQGRPETTYYYYAGRILHPFVVRMLAKAARTDLRRAFFDAAVILLLALCIFLSLCIRRFNLHPALLIPMLCVPATVALYDQYYFQDLFHATLGAAFFLAYSYSAWIALPILFLLHLTRESTLLLSSWLVVISLRRRHWAYAISVLAVAALGMGITSAAVHAALPNRHGINTLEMYVLKVPYDFCYNLLGLVFWTDTNAASLKCAPVWIINVTGHVGSIRQFGFCGFHPRLILDTLAAFLVPFGVQPAILGRLVRERWHSLPRHNEVFQTAFAYGATCLIVAPLIGVTPVRYVLYAWPLYWLALPELLKGLKCDRTRIIVLLFLYAMGCVFGFFPIGGPRYSEPVSVASLLLLNALAYGWVSKMVRAPSQTAGKLALET